MNITASARVPAEIKRQGDRKLKEMGSSATELINAAYLYVLEHGKLPQGEATHAPDMPLTKTLSGVEAQSFAETWRKRAVLDSNAYDGSNFKELLDEARGDYFARFA